MVHVDDVPDLAKAVFGTAAGWKTAVTAISDDDCAVLPIRQGAVVLTTDQMNHRPALVTFDVPEWQFSYGYLLAGTNISDLLGSGADPRALLVGLSIPHSQPDEDIDAILRGIDECCNEQQVEVVGGDTKRADRLHGYGVGIGFAESTDQLFLRNRCMPGQDVYLSGPIGDFNAAVALLQSSEPLPPNLAENAYGAICRPTLRRALSRHLASHRLASGGIDLSDGLGIDTWHLARASKVGIILDADAIALGEVAIAAGDHLGLDPLSFAFSTGGDFQFLFTAEPDYRSACSDAGALRIGTVTDSGPCLLTRNGRSSDLPRWGHSDDQSSDFGKEVTETVSRSGALLRYLEGPK